ncbi:hypothetical protein [Psychrobacillus sp. FSL K6-1415]|uniref:hypothetical protein n=1 Tax=Psychrobacillus sp. FSL K6-1415 TaxID=2921544 RepID=UPI0030FBABCD
MKKYIIIFNLLLLLIIAGCGDENLIQDDFEKDIDQAILLLDNAYEEKRALTEEETTVLDKFNDKYILGKFLLDDGTEYEMNELEKEIAIDIEGLKNFTEPSEIRVGEEDLYTTFKKGVDENLKATEIPAEIKGQYPTYESYSGIHPQFKEEANEIIDVFNPIVNGTVDNIDQSSLDILDIFVSKYQEMSFQIEEKHYLLNDESWDVLYTFVELKKAIENDALESPVKVLFNNTKEKLK